MESEDLITGIIVYLVIAFIIFLITREFWCWYFKINQRRDLLKKIHDELVILNEKNAGKGINKTDLVK